jgi:hypothetical protein
MHLDPFISLLSCQVRGIRTVGIRCTVYAHNEQPSVWWGQVSNLVDQNETTMQLHVLQMHFTLFIIYLEKRVSREIKIIYNFEQRGYGSHDRAQS